MQAMLGADEVAVSKSRAAPAENRDIIQVGSNLRFLLFNPLSNCAGARFHLTHPTVAATILSGCLCGDVLRGEQEEMARWPG